MSQSLGSLVIDIKGLELTAEDRDIISHPLVGGVILFARNYDSRQQLTDLCQQIRRTRQQPVLIMVDQEGGRVQRFQKEFTRLPEFALYGKVMDDHPALACQLVKDCAWLMATELLSCSIDLSLSPVLDLNKGLNTAIGDRAFHPSPNQVVLLAQAFMTGMKEAGMTATGKHFPGHGSVSMDSHKGMAYDNRYFDEVAAEDMLPFSMLIQHGLQALMMAHIIFSQIDSLPVGYSKYWLQEIIRKKLKFSGVIFSDDLSMQGADISSSYADRVVAAKEAGCDFTLVCNHREGVIEVLDCLMAEDFLIPMDKWTTLTGQVKMVDDYTQHPRWIKTHNILKKIDGQPSQISEKWLVS